MKLAQGDKIRMTQNGKTMEGKRLNNGSIYQVKGFDKEGNILASNGSVISKDYGNIAHGYTVTSHSSQGKTVDKVIIAQSSMSFRASSTEQFYVSVSRGKESVSIYTDDKKELLNVVSRNSQRMTATEIAQKAAKNTTVSFMDEHRQRLARLKAMAVSTVQRTKEIVSKVPQSVIKLAQVASARKFTPPPNPGRFK